jgi:methylphosphotriester-DNA--protein-cysteine methyltransferase
LEKRFRNIVGASPKKFASIVRLQNVVKNYTSGESLTHTAFESGYYDQAHFIHDFKQFTGDSPQKFLLKK